MPSKGNQLYFLSLSIFKHFLYFCDNIAKYPYLCKDIWIIPCKLEGWGKHIALSQLVQPRATRRQAGEYFNRRHRPAKNNLHKYSEQQRCKNISRIIAPRQDIFVFVNSYNIVGHFKNRHPRTSIRKIGRLIILMIILINTVNSTCHIYP